MAVTVELQGLRTFAEQYKKNPRIRADLAHIIREGAFEVARQARGRAPVRTGALRASITVLRFDELRYGVGAFAPHASYVEHGTSRMRAQPYLRPSIQEVQPRLMNLMRMSLERNLRVKIL